MEISKKQTSIHGGERLIYLPADSPAGLRDANLCDAGLCNAGLCNVDLRDTGKQ